MSRHDGVSCDSCLRNNFKGRRYKCLNCFDFDLCGTCFETGASSGRHLATHAMQCLLPKEDYELYYSGDITSIASDAPLSFTCPYCAKLGMTEHALYEHICNDHTEVDHDVVCPVCASQPGGEPNNLVSDFVAHIQRDHRSSQDEAQSTDRHQPRRISQRSVNAPSNGMNRASSRRMPFGSVPLSPREPMMDNITEILSQLSAGRQAQNGRLNATPAQQTMQQLQMQLERQHSQVRQQLDKVPRRGPSSVALSSGQIDPLLSSSVPLGGVAGSASGFQQVNSETPNTQYLLTKYINPDSSATASKRSARDDQTRKAEEPSPALVERAQFVQNLILTSLLPNSSLLKIRSSQLSLSKQEESATNQNTGPRETSGQVSDNGLARHCTVTTTGATTNPGMTMPDGRSDGESGSANVVKRRSDPGSKVQLLPKSDPTRSER